MKKLFLAGCRRSAALLLFGAVAPAWAQGQAGPPAVCPAVAPDAVPANAAVWGTGTPASCTPAALQALIDAGGPIRCNGGSQPFTVTLSAPLVVPNRDVLLDGGNLLTLSGGARTRIFDKLAAPSAALDSRLVLQRLTLRDGRAPNVPANPGQDVLGGGAIRGRAYGRLKVVDVVFEGNEGPLAQPDACGAVHTIVYQSVVFSGCTFRRNRGANGGAVGTIGSAQQFVNCVFEDNAATGTLALGGSGGALYVDGVDQNGVTNSMSLCGCAFRRNTAGYQAGAVNIIFYDGKGSSGTMDRLTFEDNTAAVDKGGALYYMNGPLTLRNSTFARNRCPAVGGGAWVTNCLLDVSNCTFTANQANDNAGGGLGGGLAIDGSGTEKRAAITNATFSANRAGNFASALFNGGNLTLANSVFHNNLTGTGNQSNPYGGGTVNKGSALTVAAGNVQWPETYAAQFGPQREDWLTPAVRVADAQLLPLASNGGPTLTQALPATSPARDWATAPGAPPTDQRGAPRLDTPDAGAYEFGSAVPLTARPAAAADQPLQLAPNPASASVRLANARPGAPVQLLDALGRAVRLYPAGTAVLDVRGLPAGQYWVRVPGQRAAQLVVE
ncbi:choice-of-anchor Q domain-containing protein [Hymenobacter sp.]|uniref:choice-of-anchor Q domain-containing protein n=1 Tax=Hymenobacter sp. TaxID=1898978 RepID=UPI00286A69DE|nr:choice-of-anchor Q domain-containing protein [Hymenobacter sp.]